MDWVWLKYKKKADRSICILEDLLLLIGSESSIPLSVDPFDLAEGDLFLIFGSIAGRTDFLFNIVGCCTREVSLLAPHPMLSVEVDDVFSTLE